MILKYRKEMAMRQRIIEISLVMMMAVVFTSCTNESRNEGLNQVKSVLESGINSNSENIEETSEKDEVKSIESPYENIDFDLTAMPKQLAYSTASRMNMMSEEYLGKIVKMNGICSIFHDEKRDIYFFTCEINDETACCTLGIEFELDDKYKFPDDFPKEKDEVTVVGVFDTYKEGARTYKTLRKAYMCDAV